LDFVGRKEKVIEFVFEYIELTRKDLLNSQRIKMALTEHDPNKNRSFGKNFHNILKENTNHNLKGLVCAGF